MSRGSDLQHSMFEAARRCGGSHETVAARYTTIRQFVAFTVEQNIQIDDVKQVRTRHFVSFIEHIRRNAQIRTLQNKAAHLRQILRECGKGDMVDSTDLSNAALGISGGSRIGTKVPMTRESIAKIRKEARYSEFPGVGLALQLQRELGLRNAEAIRHGTPSELERWIRSVDAGERLVITLGTKGGRSREATPLDPKSFADLLREAVGLARAQGGYLVPGDNLESTMRRYSNWMHRHGVTPHAARYAWAADRVEQELAKGRDMKTALRIVTNELGHGSGRTRWTRSVYCRHLLEKQRASARSSASTASTGDGQSVTDDVALDDSGLARSIIVDDRVRPPMSQNSNADADRLRTMPREQLERACLDATFRDGDTNLARACVAEIECRNVEAFGSARPFKRTR